MGMALLFAVLLLAPATLATSLKNLETLNLGTPFDPSKFNTSGPGSVRTDVIQITPDTIQGGFTFANRSGRVLYNKPFTLWDDHHNHTASFNASFVINMGQIKSNPLGEGLAFLIAPNLDLPPENSFSGFLGLTNDTSDGDAANNIFAVEFDTRKSGDYDPDGNHVGIDINSIRSNKSVSMSEFGFTLAPNDTNFYYNVWVHYDGRNHSIAVYIANLTSSKATAPIPDTPVLAMGGLNLSAIVARKSYFGFAAATGSTSLELNCVLGWNMTVEVIDGGRSGWWVGAVIGITAAAVVAAAVAVWMWWRRRESRADEENITGALKALPGMPREFSYKVLKKATGNFDDKNRLGEGGYGVVFRGLLAGEEGVEVAVKKFTREDAIKSKDDFMSELTIINRLRHKHLVRLLGWCHKNKVLLLVYEYMPNCSLDKHLFSEEQPPLSWQLRNKILQGVASALQYLHHEFDETVIHRDLKASNIMLDADFNARLGDFGLARALDQEKTSYAEMEGVQGTMGYIAPECLHTGKATRESDVYAFGAVLLEVATGQRPLAKLGGFYCLGDWVWSLHRERRIVEAVDPRLGKDFDVEEAERVLLLGLACLHPMGAERPKAQAIVQILCGSMPKPSVPPFKPAFVWPSMGPIGLDTDMYTTTDTTPITSVRCETEWTNSQSIS